MEVAADVVTIAKGILLDDAVKRRRLYERQGIPFDGTVDVETMERLFS